MKLKSSDRVKFLPGPYELNLEKNISILDSALQKKIDLNHSCGGNGTCGTCVVFLLEGAENLCPRNELESEMSQDRNFQENERLACQAYLLGSDIN